MLPFAIPGEDFAKNQVSIKNIVAARYLSAKENPKAYGNDWEKLVVELRQMMRDPQIRDALGDIEDDILFSDLTLDVQHENARQLYGAFNQPQVLEKAELPKNFIVPNKPMYRIFEIDDLDEINGFTGYFVIQEKFDGVRVQVHKLDGKVSIYTNRGRDITDKFPICVKQLEDEHFKDFILDGEAVLYVEGEPLVRSDTIGFINKKMNSDEDIRLHIFDIMHYDGEEVYKDKLEERLAVLMNNFSAHSSDSVSFPNKSNTREADSKEDLENYAKEIMENPTSEGVVIKDAKSSYIVGRKKNPKWVKWKKFVDLDVLVLECRENKNGTYSCLMGMGPVEGGPKTAEYDGKKYMKVGRAANYKDKLDVGSIIRVKVDDIVGDTKKGFTLNGAKVHEIPEVEEPDRVVTLELLASDGRKSLGDYKVEALKKSYYVTDEIHGIAKADLEPSYDGLLFHGFEGNLMGKNAWADKDMYIKQIRLAYSKDNGVFFTMVIDLLRNRSAMTIEQIYKICMEENPDLVSRLFGDKEGMKKMKQRLMKGGEANGILHRGGKFFWDGETMKKAASRKAQFEMWFTEDGSLHFIVYHEGKEYVWEIEVGEEDELYDFLGESGKYPAHVIDKASKDGLLDKGTLVIGAQRHGYHEYILTGEDIKSKLHFRYVEAFEDQKMWIAFTGYETKPAPKDSDEGLVNIYEDKYAEDNELKKGGSSSNTYGIIQLAVYKLLSEGRRYFSSNDIANELSGTFDKFLEDLQDSGIITYTIFNTHTGRRGGNPDDNISHYKINVNYPMPFSRNSYNSIAYDKIQRNLGLKYISGLLNSKSPKNAITDLQGNKLKVIKKYAISPNMLSDSHLTAYFTQEGYEEKRNEILQEIEQGYESLLELGNQNVREFNLRTKSYAKFDIDLPAELLRISRERRNS